MRLTFLTGLMLVLPLIAQAQDTYPVGNTERWFLGVGIGSVGFDDDGYSEDAEDDIYDQTGYHYDVDAEADDSSLSLKFGYRFNRVVGVELSYIDYGEVSYEVDGYEFWAPEFTAIALAANIGFTFDSGWRPFALIGLSSLDVDSEIGDDRYVGFHYGFGGEYTPPQMSALTFRLAYEGDIFVEDSLEDDYPYDTYTMDIGTIALGMTFNF